MPDDGRTENKRRRLQAIVDKLEDARDEADDLRAHLLAAKVEDSRICAEEMIEELG